jgi:DNA-binding NarL/FixJ family response regulator
MKLALSSHEQTLVANAMRALVSPLLKPTFDDWLCAVNVSLKELLAADKASFMFPIDDDEIRTVSDDFPSAVLQHYMREKLPEIEMRWGTRRRSLELGVFNRALIYADRLTELYRSEYYNEYLVAHRAFDVLGMATTQRTSHQGVILYLHHDRPTGRRFGRRGLALSRMLYPAFKAGVHASQTLFAQRRGIARIIDHVPSGIALADAHGRILHRNRALRAMMSDEPRWELMEQALQASLRACVGANVSPGTASRFASPPPHRPVRDIAGVAGRYSLNAVPLDADARAADASIVVIVERSTAPTFHERALRERFHLTTREVEVARLLCDGLTNTEIASRVAVSECTARHHTESVMLKLGIHSRARITCAISQVCDEPAALDVRGGPVTR